MSTLWFTGHLKDSINELNKFSWLYFINRHQQELQRTKKVSLKCGSISDWLISKVEMFTLQAKRPSPEVHKADGWLCWLHVLPYKWVWFMSQGAASIWGGMSIGMIGVRYLWYCAQNKLDHLAKSKYCVANIFILLYAMNFHPFYVVEIICWKCFWFKRRLCPLLP